MIKSIELCFNHASKVKQLEKVEFKPGYNVLIGQNGFGKSTILRALHSCDLCEVQHYQSAQKTETVYYSGSSLEKTLQENRFPKPLADAIRSRELFSSHGESNKELMSILEVSRANCFLLDDPEMGLDVEARIKLARKLREICTKRKNTQVIVASHDPFLWYGKNTNVVEIQEDYFQETLKKYNSLMTRYRS